MTCWVFLHTRDSYNHQVHQYAIEFSHNTTTDHKPQPAGWLLSRRLALIYTPTHTHTNNQVRGIFSKPYEAPSIVTTILLGTPLPAADVSRASSSRVKGSTLPTSGEISPDSIAGVASASCWPLARIKRNL